MWTQVREPTLGGGVEQGRLGQEHPIEEAVSTPPQEHNDEGHLVQRQGTWGEGDNFQVSRNGEFCLQSGSRGWGKRKSF